MLPQLEKNHVVPTAWQDEALARDGVSREVPCSALKPVDISLSCVFLGQAWVLGAGAGAGAGAATAAVAPPLHLLAEISDGRDGANVG